MDQADEILTRGVANIIPGKDELRKLLESDKKLNIYFGIDPTSTKIHLGHAVTLRKLQKLADLGHNVTFLIGDFTSLIGDTSDKDTERPVLTSEQIEANFQTYKKQAEKLLDFSKINVRHNSEWLKKLTFEEIIKLCQHFSVGDFISRELIRKRLDTGKRIGLHELLYPVMQGYDSYFLDTDLQLGGTDQTFNMQAGRTLQLVLRKKESYVMSNVLLEGTDGRKMSKSWNNAIWLEDQPNDMYAKVMAIHDEYILNYFTLATNAALSEIEEIKKQFDNGEHPMTIKKHLAQKIVTELHSEEDAAWAQEAFEKIVQNKELPDHVTEIKITNNQILDEDFLVRHNLTNSKSEAKRLFEQGGIQINEQKINKENPIYLQPNMIIRIGKRKIIKIILEQGA